MLSSSPILPQYANSCATLMGCISLWGGPPNLLLLLGWHNNYGQTTAVLLPVLQNAFGGRRHQVCDSVLWQWHLWKVALPGHVQGLGIITLPVFTITFLLNSTLTLCGSANGAVFPQGKPLTHPPLKDGVAAPMNHF